MGKKGISLLTDPNLSSYEKIYFRELKTKKTLFSCVKEMWPDGVSIMM